WCWQASGPGSPNIAKPESITPNGPWQLSLAAGDPERGPGAQVDHIAVAQRDGFAGRDFVAVDQRAVGRPGIDDGPGALGGRDENHVQARHAGVGRGAGQVDLRVDAP